MLTFEDFVVGMEQSRIKSRMVLPVAANLNAA